MSFLFPLKMLKEKILTINLHAFFVCQQANNVNSRLFWNKYITTSVDWNELQQHELKSDSNSVAIWISCRHSVSHLQRFVLNLNCIVCMEKVSYMSKIKRTNCKEMRRMSKVHENLTIERKELMDLHMHHRVIQSYSNVT